MSCVNYVTEKKNMPVFWIYQDSEYAWGFEYASGSEYTGVLKYTKVLNMSQVLKQVDFVLGLLGDHVLMWRSLPWDIEILGWYPAGPVLSHGEKVPL